MQPDSITLQNIRKTDTEQLYNDYITNLASYQHILALISMYMNRIASQNLALDTIRTITLKNIDNAATEPLYSRYIARTHKT